MVPFKGRSKLKEYNPPNQKNWDTNCMFLLALKVKTLISEFTQFTIERCRGQTDFQASGNIVMHLMSKIHVITGISFSWRTGILKYLLYQLK